MEEILLRFVVGGIVVSSFAVLGDLFKPRSFAGLFAAAPSVALATLGLTVASEGGFYAATEARSMIAGAVAFFIYASGVSSDDALQVEGSGGDNFINFDVAGHCFRALVCLFAIAFHDSPSQRFRSRQNEVVRIWRAILIRRTNYGNRGNHRESIRSNSRRTVLGVSRNISCQCDPNREA